MIQGGDFDSWACCISRPFFLCTKVKAIIGYRKQFIAGDVVDNNGLFSSKPKGLV